MYESSLWAWWQNKVFFNSIQFNSVVSLSSVESLASVKSLASVEYLAFVDSLATVESLASVKSLAFVESLTSVEALLNHPLWILTKNKDTFSDPTQGSTHPSLPPGSHRRTILPPRRQTGPHRIRIRPQTTGNWRPGLSRTAAPTRNERLMWRYEESCSRYALLDNFSDDAIA